MPIHHSNPKCDRCGCRHAAEHTGECLDATWECVVAAWKDEVVRLRERVRLLETALWESEHGGGPLKS